MALAGSDLMLVETAGDGLQFSTTVKDITDYVSANGSAGGGGGGTGGEPYVSLSPLSGDWKIHQPGATPQMNGPYMVHLETYTYSGSDKKGKAGPGFAENKAYAMEFMASNSRVAMQTPTSGETPGGIRFTGSTPWISIWARISNSTAQQDPKTCLSDLYVENCNFYPGLNKSANSLQFGTQNVKTITANNVNYLFRGYDSTSAKTYYPSLTSITGDCRLTGYIPAGVSVVATTVRGSHAANGDIDLRNNNLTAKNIGEWILSSYFDTQNFTDGYFKVVRFDGGTSAAYEDLSDAAKDRIAELQSRGYTFVMNGTGNSTAVNVTQGNVGLTFVTESGNYIPIDASTSACIMPSDNYTGLAQYSTLSAIVTYMRNNLTDFKSSRVLGPIPHNTDLYAETVVEKNLGDSTTLDATCTTGLSDATVAYQWFKTVDGYDEEIPNETSATLTGTSLTADQFGSYRCIISVSHPSTDRTLTLEKDFRVVETPSTQTLSDTFYLH